MKYFAFLHASEVGLMRSHCSTRFFLRNTSSGRVGSRNWSVGCTVGGVIVPAERLEAMRAERERRRRTALTLLADAEEEEAKR